MAKRKPIGEGRVSRVRLSILRQNKVIPTRVGAKRNKSGKKGKQK